MGGTCSTYERDEKCIQYFGVKPEGRDHSHYLAQMERKH